MSPDRHTGAHVRGIDSHVLSASLRHSRSNAGVLSFSRSLQEQAKVCRIRVLPCRGNRYRSSSFPTRCSKVVWLRYTVSLLWPQRQSSPSFSGEVTRTSNKSWVVGRPLRRLTCPSLNVIHPLALKSFISYRRYETMSLHDIMQGLSTTGCRWTASSSASSSHIPASDSLKRRELLEEFIIWYFGSFVAPLLRASLTARSVSFSRIDIRRLRFMLQNPRHSRIEYCISVKTIGMCFVHPLSIDLLVSHSLNWKR
jgi:RNA-binding protein of telomerase ribonucleoprotein complex